MTIVPGHSVESFVAMAQHIAKAAAAGNPKERGGYTIMGAGHTGIQIRAIGLAFESGPVVAIVHRVTLNQLLASCRLSWKNKCILNEATRKKTRHAQAQR
eukprot:INCI10739.1.p4 GENE.INCI10739.1~~INCI10739.1.p4  ORF type:complete len:100 (+),score=11.03 INCI10739.1:410-709(+)